MLRVCPECREDTGTWRDYHGETHFAYCKCDRQIITIAFLIVVTFSVSLIVFALTSIKEIPPETAEKLRLESAARAKTEIKEVSNGASN